MASRRLLAIVALFIPVCVAGGCSLVNSFDGVKPLLSGDDGGPGDSSLIDHAPPIGDGAGPSDAPEEAATLDASTDADAAPLAPSGAIVVGGAVATDGGKKFVLSVINPATGVEFAASRETMKVTSVQYDGVRDLWYIFESKGADAIPTVFDAVDLHVRTLDTHTGVWTEKQKLTVPTLVVADDVAVLRDRLVYVAYQLNDGAPPSFKVVVLDTSTPSAVAPHSEAALANSPIGLIGTRNPSGPGGTLNLMQLDTNECVGDGGLSDACSLKLLHVTVPASSAPLVAASLSPAIGVVPKGGGASAGAGSYLGGGPDDVFAFPPANGSAAYVLRLSPATHNPVSQPVTFPLSALHLQPLAISECFNMAFVVSVPSDTNVYGVPLNGGPVVQKSFGHPGQFVRFEPFTSTLLTPGLTGATYELTAFSLTGTAQAPVLTKRQAPDWTPPADLQPIVVTVKQPLVFTCP